jgi:hypothetical protein
MTDREKGPPLTLVADNLSAALKKHCAQQELERYELQATDAIRQLAINLLRIIAGAGEPWSLLRNIDDARTAYIDYLQAAKEVDHPVALLTREIDLDHLFSRQFRENEPTTEEDWLHWAQPSDPYEEYSKSNERAKVELRRAALRQVALALSSGETDPHLKAHGGNLDEILRRMFDEEKQIEQERLKPAREGDSKRQAIAQRKIAELRRENRMRQLKSLPPHQVVALRKVQVGAVEQTDRFTLDVLGSMNLLVRPKGSKKKSDWQLTEEGLLALDMHKE